MPIALIGLAATAYGAVKQHKAQKQAAQSGEAGYVAPGGSATPAVQSVNQNVTVQASSPNATTGATTASSTIPVNNPYYPITPSYYSNQTVDAPYIPTTGASQPFAAIEASLAPNLPLLMIVGIAATAYALLSETRH